MIKKTLLMLFIFQTRILFISFLKSIFFPNRYVIDVTISNRNVFGSNITKNRMLENRYTCNVSNEELNLRLWSDNKPEQYEFRLVNIKSEDPISVSLITMNINSQNFSDYELHFSFRYSYNYILEASNKSIQTYIFPNYQNITIIGLNIGYSPSSDRELFYQITENKPVSSFNLFLFALGNKNADDDRYINFLSSRFSDSLDYNNMAIALTIVKKFLPSVTQLFVESSEKIMAILVDNEISNSFFRYSYYNFVSNRERDTAAEAEEKIIEVYVKLKNFFKKLRAKIRDWGVELKKNSGKELFDKPDFKEIKNLGITCENLIEVKLFQKIIIYLSEALTNDPKKARYIKYKLFPNKYSI